MRGNTKQITEILSNYNIVKAELLNKERIYNERSKNIGSGINMSSEKTGRTYKITSETENLAIYLADYKTEIDNLKMLIDIIDTALCGLCIKEREIITLKYIEGTAWWKVAKQLELSEKWCKTIKKEAFKKLIRSIPIEVFSDIFFN